MCALKRLPYWSQPISLFNFYRLLTRQKFSDKTDSPTPPHLENSESVTGQKRAVDL